MITTITMTKPATKRPSQAKDGWGMGIGKKSPAMLFVGDTGWYDLNVICAECKVSSMTWVGYKDHMLNFHPLAELVIDPRPTRTRAQMLGMRGYRGRRKAT